MSKFDVKEWAIFGFSINLVWATILSIFSVIIISGLRTDLLFTAVVTAILASFTLIILGTISWIVMGYIHEKFLVLTLAKFSTFWKIAGLKILSSGLLMLVGLNTTPVFIIIVVSPISAFIILKIAKFAKIKIPKTLRRRRLV